MQNQVYFFAVTNLRYWVFGQFVSLPCTYGLVPAKVLADH